MATSRSDRPSLRKDGLASGGAPLLRRVLIANRGEIAVRLIRACRDLGIGSVAIFSEVDREALHVRMADRAMAIGGSSPSDSYLRIDAILAAAREADVDAIHPGYGFLAERAAFAKAVEDAGLVFVGPGSATIALLGDKLAARRLAEEVGVPVVPGTLKPVVTSGRGAATLVAAADRIGFPLLVKAAAGGGGRGMRRVASRQELPDALALASAEAAAAFGDGAVYLERELSDARHVEVQLLGDQHDHVIALGERDCSLQRRHQKLVEEAPAPGLDPIQRRELHDGAVRLGRAAGLRSAATAEFLLTPDGQFHFLEVNTRLQVEHGVTELVWGIDLVHEQLRIAAGQPISATTLAAASDAADPSRHAIEVRLTAEDPSADFAPTPGRVQRWVMPGGPGVRVDAGVETGDPVPAEYDNLIAKLMVVGPDRGRAIDRLARALAETEIGGIQTTLPFHRFVASSPAFRDARQLSTAWVDQHWDGPAARRRAEAAAALGAAIWTIEGGATPARSTSTKVSGPGGWREAARNEGVARWPGRPRG